MPSSSLAESDDIESLSATASAQKTNNPCNNGFYKKSKINNNTTKTNRVDLNLKPSGNREEHIWMGMKQLLPTTTAQQQSLPREKCTSEEFHTNWWMHKSSEQHQKQHQQSNYQVQSNNHQQMNNFYNNFHNQKSHQQSSPQFNPKNDCDGIELSSQLVSKSMQMNGSNGGDGSGIFPSPFCCDYDKDDYDEDYVGNDDDIDVVVPSANRQLKNTLCSKEIKRHHGCKDDSVEDGNDCQSQVSQPLCPESVACETLLNPNEDDEMKVIGYRYSRSRTLLFWLCIFLTGGILRLVMHWWRHWYLIATHSPCPLDVAEKVLVKEDYQGNHKLFYVKNVETLSYHSIKKSQQATNEGLCPYIPNQQEDIDEKTFHLSVHLSSAQFKYAKTVRLFRCKQLRYIWDVNSRTFVKLKGLDVNIPCTYLHQQKGLSLNEQIARRCVYGINQITVPYRNVMTLLFLEVLNPFYVFQIFSVILWFTYDYYYYAVVIMMMSAFGISMSIIQTKKTQDALRATVQSTGCASVINDRGNVDKLDTQYLVPGDVIEIPSTGCTMYCDAVLISGNCILDESMLTGESVPVTKTPLPMKRDLIFDKKEHARHTLFCGTKVIQTRYIGSEKVLAIVINTGNITAKGGLIRSIIYPPPVDYKFEQDSYKFIAILGLIAGIGFLHTLVTKIIRNVDPIKIAVESLDLITIVVPPALPAAMTVGRYYAQKRLQRNNIYCISPRSINVSGSINCVCFDKTGTLTEDGLDMWGVVPKSSTNQFQIVLKQIIRLPNDHLLYGMVTCHSITIMNGEMRGDPLDLKMFESTGWILEDVNVPDDNKYDLLFPTIVRQPKSKTDSSNSLKNNEKEDEFNTINAPFCSRKSVDDLMADAGLAKDDYNDIGIVREFPFSSALQRMSVITRRLSDDHFNVYCKGSPEMIRTLCNPKSMPDDYFHQLNIYAQQGYRIIAIAYKPLERKMTYPKVQRIGRDKIECDLEFLGFVIMENRLKPDTTEVIRNLNDANIRTIMVTGDNILTALSVAHDCGIVDKRQSVITVNTRPHPKSPNQYEVFYNLTGAVVDGSGSCGGGGSSSNNVTIDVPIDVDITSLNSTSAISLDTCDTWTHQDIESGLNDEDKDAAAMKFKFGNKTVKKMNIPQLNGNAYDELKMYPVLPSNNYRFAMIGETWSIVREHFPELVSAFVTRGAIFARMSPDQKQSLIMELQAINYYVAMCGDGANDCGALKVAHTGISLSETEASIASPFTSRNPTIACVPKVIKEGRAALVTSFGIFKYMAAYSMVQFVSVMILYSIDSNLTDKQYLFIDLGLISIFAFFFGQTEAYAGPLVKQTPLSSLISLTPMASIILQLCTVISFQLIGWHHLHLQSWFVPFQPSANEDHLGCYENYTMFAISCFQYIILAFVFSKGAPYRKSIASNIPFCMSLTINLFIVVYLILCPAEWLIEQFELIMPPDQTYRIYMLFYGFGNLLISLFIEHIIVEYFLFQIVRFKFHNIEKSHRKYLSIENKLRKNIKWPPLSDYQPEICNDYDKIEQSMSYAEIGAEHSIDTKTPEDSVLNSFFEFPTVSTELATASATAAATESNKLVTKHNHHHHRRKPIEILSLSDITSESNYESAANDDTIFEGFSSNENSLTRNSNPSILDCDDNSEEHKIYKSTTRPPSSFSSPSSLSLSTSSSPPASLSEKSPTQHQQQQQSDTNLVKSNNNNLRVFQWTNNHKNEGQTTVEAAPPPSINESRRNS